MKPYAYAVVQGVDGMENVSLQFDHPEMCGQKYRQAIPLFTHPVKEQVETIEYTCPNCQTHVGLHVKHPVKELTDEEIMDIKTLMEINYGCVPPLEFAWAILRKAQEK